MRVNEVENEMKKFVVALADVVNTGLLSRWREGIISNSLCVRIVVVQEPEIYI